MAKSKVNKTVSRKDHLQRKVLLSLEILGEKPHNKTTEKEFKTISKLLISDNLTTKEVTGLLSRVTLLARAMGGING